MIKNSEKLFSEFPTAELLFEGGLSRFKFCSYAYQYPEILKGEDADWQKNQVAFYSSGFQSEFDETCFQGRELKEMATELLEFYNLNRETVELLPIEPHFGLSFSFNPLRKVMVKGWIQYLDNSITLKFDLETSLSDLKNFIDGIQSILNRFPPRN
jgi:hypothetical protein